MHLVHENLHEADDAVASARKVRGYKQTGNELADRQAELKFALLSERQQAEKLSEQIVQSPERLQRSVAGIQSEVDKERALVAAADRRNRDLHTRNDVVHKACLR
eukprot:scaffold178837_cov34-Prasinocladus_malaysianus.AAC.1